jgi:hypothetical protein
VDIASALITSPDSVSCVKCKATSARAQCRLQIGGTSLAHWCLAAILPWLVAVIWNCSWKPSDLQSALHTHLACGSTVCIDVGKKAECCDVDVCTAPDLPK